MSAKATMIDLLVLDVDGILTDGGVYVTEDGRISKRFSIFDGMGIKMLLEAGIGVAVVSGHASEATVHRLKGLGVENVQVGVADKGEAFDDLLSARGLSPRRVAAMGDDLPDLPMLQRAGFKVTVPEGHIEVKRIADLVTERRGGHGAVREVAEHLLHAKGLYDTVVGRHRR